MLTEKNPEDMTLGTTAIWHSVHFLFGTFFTTLFYTLLYTPRIVLNKRWAGFYDPKFSIVLIRIIDTCHPRKS